jgi:quercetin dioxygenase-like cupin family protein
LKPFNYTKVELEQVTEPGANGAKIRWLISKKDGALNFAMRLIEIEPNGYSSLHQHDWEHEVFILEGKGCIRSKNNEESLNPGDVIYIEPLEWHQLINKGNSIFKFICSIPSQTD